MTISTALTALDRQRENLAANLTTKGVTAASTETLASLVPKVLTISGGGSGGLTSDGLVLQLDGINNTGIGHSASATTWKDLTGTVADASKNAGTTTWGDKYLNFDGSSYWHIAAPHGSRGTLEVVIAIDTSFIPSGNWAWYRSSAIAGQELGGTQRDFAILVDPNGKFAIGYDNSTVYSSSINARDGLPHTISYSYLNGPIIFAIDGTVISTRNLPIGGTEISTIGIGWQNEYGGTAIKGKMYGLRFYNRVLSPKEIQNNFNYDKSYYGF